MRTDFVPLIYLTPTVRTKPTNHRVSWNIFKPFPEKFLRASADSQLNRNLTIPC